jgi:hypothetical protein
VELFLRVWIYVFFQASSKEDLLNTIADELAIAIEDTNLHSRTFDGFIDNRNRIDTFSSYKFQIQDEMVLGGKLFHNVIWDEKYTDEGVGYITYFNKDYGLIAIASRNRALIMRFERFE